MQTPNEYSEQDVEDALARAAGPELLKALREIRQMSLDAKKGPAHVAKLTLQMMVGVAEEAIAKVECT